MPVRHATTRVNDYTQYGIDAQRDYDGRHARASDYYIELFKRLPLVMLRSSLLQSLEDNMLSMLFYMLLRYNLHIISL